MTNPRLIVGVDIGGTKVVVGTVPEDGSTVFGLQQVPTRVADGADAVVGQVTRLVANSLEATKTTLGVKQLDVIGVGIGAPGPMDIARGMVLMSPNLGWRDFPLRDRVSEEVGLPAALDNDANCAVFGEWWMGAARGAHTVIGLTIGTGIGGGFVLGGDIYHGASDIAGEFGHMSIDSTGRRCKCGNYGCLEAYASGTAIASRAIEGIEAGAETRLPAYVGDHLEAITAQVVYEAARDGDDYALEVIKDTAHFLGAGVANLVNIFNPEIVVILGGVTAAGDRLFAPLRAEVTRRAFRPAVQSCRIVPGELPGTAGVFGAVAAFKVQTTGSV
ncbi:MAG: ROK family protein [Gemmatimonadales bacterium]|nr:ROK family protein [Gemmatimonadales bacterium]NIN50713.1 ROK family protein [Gemmatimonadales bacterium]NIP08177.1 ROK family protein [Gemmatimonadales bacterium]NIR01055.1 ROK family protein [Gemmatimonadales bacterium]NIS65134.1 ROK family protein [Gemmatimonadales bacterium]